MIHEAGLEALEIARVTNYDVMKVRRVIDTEFEIDYPCWIITMDDNGGLVIYEDEPDCIVSLGNKPGRFVEVSS